MKIKQIFIVILLSLFLLPLNVFADDNDVIVKSIELVNKSDNVEELSQASASGTNINVNIKLYDPKDYIEYSLLIKNNSQDDYTFDDSKLETSNDYLSYKFSYSESSNVLKPGEERNVKLTITYINKVPQDKLTNDFFTSESKISLTLNDNVITPNIVNPETGLTNPILYVIVMFISLVGIFITLKISKKIKLIMIVLTSLLVLPIYTVANKKIDIKLNANITIDGKEAYFLPGSEFNIKVKQLAGNDTTVNGYNTSDNFIKTIKISDVEPTETNKEDKNVASNADSPNPIYMWIKEGTLYLWSLDKTLNLNEDAAHMFKNFKALNSIDDMRRFDTSKTTTFMQLFYGDTQLTSDDLTSISDWNVSNVKSIKTMFSFVSIDNVDFLKNWDVSSVEDASYAFQVCGSLVSIDGLSNWNTSSFKNMYGMFMGHSSIGDNHINSLEGLRNWDVSNVEEMSYLFQRNADISDLSPIENWDVSNVKKMRGMFLGNTSLTNASPLSKWKVTSLHDILAMFQSSSVTNLNGIDKWNISNITDIRGLVQNDLNLEEADLSLFDLSNITDASTIFKGDTNLQRIKTPKAYPTDVNVKINLPYAFCDSDNNQYLKLDNTSPTETWLTKCE